MQQRIDHIISELLALKSEIETKQTESNEQPVETSTESPIESSNEPSTESEQSSAEARSAESTEQSNELNPIRRRTNRSFPLNKSKFLNDEQRDQVLQFASDHKETIMNQPRSNRIQFLQNLIREQLNINLSLYMTGKLIQIISSNN